jgi:hypothetical protein
MIGFGTETDRRDSFVSGRPTANPAAMPAVPVTSLSAQ